MTPWGSRAATVSIWLAALALVVFLPGAFNRWFLPKELLFLLAATIGAFAAAAGRVPRLVWGWIAAAAAVLLLSALLSEAPLASLFGRWPRYEGLVTLPVMVLAVWWGARMLGPRAESRRDAQWIAALTVAASAIAAVAVLETLGLQPIPTDLARPGSLLGNATDQGVIAAAVTAVLLPAVMQGTGRDRRVPAIGVGAGVLATVLSGSRAGMLALCAGVVIALAAWVWLRRREGERNEVIRGLGIAATVLGSGAVLVFALPDARNRVLGFSEYAAATVNDRWLIWAETVGLAAQHPWLGVGPGGYVDAIAVAHGSEWFATVDPGVVLDSPHSWPLQALMAGGVPLLLLVLGFLAFIGILGVQAVRTQPLVVPATGKARVAAERESRSLAAHRFRVIGTAGGLTALLVGWLTHFPAPATGLLAGMLIGVCCAAPPRPMASALAAAGRRIRAGALLVWLLLFALVTAAEFPLSAAMRAESAAAADRQFGLAQQLRPWDGDVASIAAQTFASRASQGALGAGDLGIQWAERALQRTPGSLPALVALGVSQRAEGQLQSAVSTLRRAHEAQPLDPQISVQFAVTLARAGQPDAARSVVAQALAHSPDHPQLNELHAALGYE